MEQKRWRFAQAVGMAKDWFKISSQFLDCSLLVESNNICTVCLGILLLPCETMIVYSRFLWLLSF